MGFRVLVCIQGLLMKKFLGFVFLFLVLLAIAAGIAMWKFPWIQEKLGFSTNDDKILASQAAELALKEAETWLSSQKTKPTAVQKCSQPPCMVWQKAALPANLAEEKDSWWQTQGRPYTQKIPGLSIPPRYVIEEYEFVAQELNPDELSKKLGYSHYKVTARGIGKSEKSQSVLESIYSVKFN